MPTSSASCALVVVVAAIVVASQEVIVDWFRALSDQGPQVELIWPPSRQSATPLVSIFLAIAGVCLRSVMDAQSSQAQRNLHETKRKRAQNQLAEALRWDAEDDADDSGNDGEDKMKKGDDDNAKKEKRPPEAKELFEMLFDEVEERHVTDFGISPADPTYSAVLALFKETVPRAVEEATRCTRLARGIATSEERGWGDDMKRAVLFKDGHRLRELLELYEGKRRGVASIKKHFGALVPDPILRRARECSRSVDREQREGGVSVLFRLARPHLPLYVLSASLMAFDSAVGAANWHGVAQLLDGVDAGTMSLDELRALFLQVYTKFVLCVFAHLTSCFMTEKVAGRFGNAIKGEVLRGVLRQDTVFFDVYPSGVIQERLNHDANDLTSKCFHLPMEILHLTLMIVSNSLAVYQIKPELLWMCMTPLPLIALIQKGFISYMSRMHSRSRKIAERVVADTNEVIKEMRTVRSFAMEAEAADLYDAQSAYRTRITEHSSIVHHCLFIAPLVLMFIGTRLLATYNGGTYVASKVITVGMAIQVGMAADHLQHAVRRVLEQLPEMMKVLGPVGRICDAISSRPLIEPYPGGPAKLQIPIVGRLDFIDVDFTFPSEPQKPILSHVSFSASPGEKVALVGGTGSGKSTIIQIIQRFYAQSSGDVLLDGRPIEDFDVHYLRRRISVVAQDNVLFSTTIRENVTYGLPRVERDALTDADIEAACRRANAWTFINGFPRKLETFCGERGVKLSGGQKQRLAIARAIIRKPTICLLDEATSALDSRSELVVQKALDQMIEEHASGCTLVIAHRLSTVKNCDRILVMDSGRVVESGTHDELLAVPIVKERGGADPAETAESARTVAGIYHELWNTQMGMGGGIDDSGTKDKALDDMRKQVAALQAEVIALRLPEHPSDVELTTPEQVESMQEDQKSPTASQTASDTSTEASDAEDGCE